VCIISVLTARTALNSIGELPQGVGAEPAEMHVYGYGRKGGSSVGGLAGGDDHREQSG
jgi:hypothetical protein